MECIKCGSGADLNMYPLRWDGEGNAIGFVFICDKCQNDGDLKIRWSIDDESDSEEETEQAG